VSGFSGSLLQSSVSHDPSEIILTCLFAAEFGLLDHIFSEQKYSFL